MSRTTPNADDRKMLPAAEGESAPQAPREIIPAVHPAKQLPDLVKKLKKQEAFFTRLNRKRRSMIGSIVSNMLGESAAEPDYHYVPEERTAAPTATAGPKPATSSLQPSIKDEIEEEGLFGGL